VRLLSTLERATTNKMLRLIAEIGPGSETAKRNAVSGDGQRRGVARVKAREYGRDAGGQDLL